MGVETEFRERLRALGEWTDDLDWEDVQARAGRPKTRHRWLGRSPRQLAVVAAAASAAALGVVLAGVPFGDSSSRSGDAAAAVLRAFKTLATSDKILHVVVAESAAEVSSFDPLVGIDVGRRASREVWQLGDERLRARARYLVEGATPPYEEGLDVLVTPRESLSYTTHNDTVTTRRFASPAEQREFFNAYRAFDSAVFRRAVEEGRVRFLGRATWREREVLHFEYVYDDGRDRTTFLVDPQTYFPQVILADSVVNGDSQRVSVLQFEYTTFELLEPTPENLARLEFEPPADAEVVDETTPAFEELHVGDPVPDRWRSAFRPDSIGGVRGPASENPPIADEARAALVQEYGDGNQIVVFTAPRERGGDPCWAVLHNRPDGRQAGLGVVCPYANGGNGLFVDPSSDLRFWLVAGMNEFPEVKQLELRLGERRIPIPIHPGGLVAAAIPATGPLDQAVHLVGLDGNGRPVPTYPNFETSPRDYGAEPVG